MGVVLTIPYFLPPAVAVAAAACTYGTTEKLCSRRKRQQQQQQRRRIHFAPSPHFLLLAPNPTDLQYSTSLYIGDMGGTTGQDNPAKWISLTPSGSNDNLAKDYVPSSIDFSSQRITVEAEKHNNIPFALPIYSSRTPLQQTSHNQVKFLPTSSAVMHAGSARDIPKDVLVPVRGIHNAKGVFELERGTLYNSSGNDPEASDSYHDMDALEATQSRKRLNSNNGKAPMSLSNFLQSDEENCSVPVALRLSSRDDRVSSNVFEPPTVTVAVPGLCSSEEAPSRTSTANRVCRSRITEVLKSLQELLPHLQGGSRGSVLDGTIDCIKCLQLQIKTLSQSRLGGEASHDPFVYLEGYGHYLFHDEMLSEPLEEIIGRLMEVNMPLLNQLLESKGLAVMPMGLAGGLL